MAGLRALDLLQAISWTLYVVIFVVTAVRAVYSPRKVKVDVALLFAAPMLIIVIGLITASLPAAIRPGAVVISSCLLMSLPYFLIRLVDDFTGAPTLLLRITEAGLVVSIVAILVVPQPYPAWVDATLIAYFIIVEVYGAGAFIRAAGQSRGVTRRRMQAIAAGSLFVGLILLVAGLPIAVPSAAALAETLSQIAGVASAISYFLGFTPPAWLRRAWQAPELRAAMHQSPALVRLPDQTEAVRQLEQTTADAVGATNASIVIWDDHLGDFRFGSNGNAEQLLVNQGIFRRVFASQQPIFHEVRRVGTGLVSSGGQRHPAILVAPINLAKRRIGVVAVFSQHASIFAEEDLEVVTLLADHIAIILENRALVEESARERARAEALAIAEEERRQMYAELEVRVAERTTDLQQALDELESFSYSVSHDLRAPLRTIDGFSQAILEDYYDQLGEEGQSSLRRIRAASQRMSELIDGLLRLSRITRSDFHRERVDLSNLVRGVVAELRRAEPSRQVSVIVHDDVFVDGDALLLRVAIENLIGNAWKFTSKRDGASIEFSVDGPAGQETYCVRDNGAGFDMTYADKLFGPFQRLHRRDEFDGTGIGLATVRRIIVRHGGKIWAQADVDRGAAFFFTLNPSLPDGTGEESSDRPTTEPAISIDLVSRR